jgi:XTP/dITP diphosphohydrolase
MQIVFVTGNEYKFQVAKEALASLDIELIQQDLETPEIQSTEVEEIASFSAKWASDRLKKPVVLTDAGYYIEALNGFPGPFIKFTNKWFTAEDYLNLMRGKQNRTVITRDCLAYCEPGKESHTIMGEAKARIAEKAGAKGTTPINEIFIPEGFDRVESEISREEMVKFWNEKMQTWPKFAEYLKSSNKG